MAARLTIGQLAKRSGLAVSTLRYYSDAGLLPAERTTGGTRHYPRSALRRLGFIRVTQQTGYSLQAIKALLDQLPNSRTPTQADWRKISARMRKDLNARIQTLEATRDALDGCIGCGCLSLKTCQLYNPDDTAASQGSGARFIPPEIR